MPHEHGKHHAHAHNHGHGHHGDAHGDAHGHALDRGWAGFVRYASILPRMWTSEVSSAVVGLIAPRPGEQVVEIGAGMGAAMIVAARSGAKVAAVDPTPYMRRIMRLRLLAASGRRHVRIVEGAAESIPLPDASVDAVWSVNTVHHWSNIDGALREIHRVLRPGGRLLLVDEDFDDPAHPEHAHVQKRRARHAHAFADIEPAAFEAQLRSLGFKTAQGSVEKIAGRPAKVVSGVKG